MAEEYTIEGINEVLEKLNEAHLSKVSDEFCQEVGQNVPEPILDAMQSDCPVETGELRDSFVAEATELKGEGVVVRIGPNVAIHQKSKLPNFILAGIFEWGGRVGNWIRAENGTRLGKRSHKRRSAKSHEEQDTIPATMFMTQAWQRTARQTLDTIIDAAKKNLLESFE